MKKNFSITSELNYLCKVELHLVRVCRKLYSDPLYQAHFDDLYHRLTNVIGCIDDVLEYCESNL